jgi:putative acetyltransferase
LIEKALERLRENPAANGCVVLGDPNYYGRFGFKHEPRVKYGDVPPPYFQVLQFRGQPPIGAVQYHEAFAAGG